MFIEVGDKHDMLLYHLVKCLRSCFLPTYNLLHIRQVLHSSSSLMIVSPANSCLFGNMLEYVSGLESFFLCDLVNLRAYDHLPSNFFSAQARQRCRL